MPIIGTINYAGNPLMSNRVTSIGPPTKLIEVSKTYITIGISWKNNVPNFAANEIEARHNGVYSGGGWAYSPDEFFLIEGMEHNKEYEIRVRTYDQYYNPTAWSAPLTITTNYFGEPPVITDVSVINDYTLGITWDHYTSLKSGTNESFNISKAYGSGQDWGGVSGNYPPLINSANDIRNFNKSPYTMYVAESVLTDNGETVYMKSAGFLCPHLTVSYTIPTNIVYTSGSNNFKTTYTDTTSGDATRVEIVQKNELYPTGILDDYLETATTVTSNPAGVTLSWPGNVTKGAGLYLSIRLKSTTGKASNLSTPVLLKPNGYYPIPINPVAIDNGDGTIKITWTNPGGLNPGVITNVYHSTDPTTIQYTTATAALATDLQCFLGSGFLPGDLVSIKINYSRIDTYFSAYTDAITVQM